MSAKAKKTPARKRAKKASAPVRKERPAGTEHIAETYAREVLDGTRPACKWIKLACARFVRDLEREDLIFCHRSADRAIGFIQTFRHYKGEFAGRRMLMEPWQKFVVANIFGWKRKADGRRRFKYAHIEVPRKNGKALCLNTPIPTPDGWKTMGEIQAGDYVLGDDGKPARVLGTWDHFKPCYRVEFSNGEAITACEDHLWKTEAKVNAIGVKQGRPMKRHTDAHGVTLRVRTTKEIAESLRYGKRQDLNHTVALPAPLDLPPLDLPLDPYVLGAWLGDGHSPALALACGDEDAAFMQAQLEGAGFAVEATRQRTCWKLFVRGGFAALDAVGIRRNKHIPARYLRASYAQRLALLQGLMDTDGYVDALGKVFEFTTILPRLADGVCELLASMGIKHTKRRKSMRCNGLETGKDCYMIQFNTFADAVPCFRLPRKLARMRRLADCKSRPRSKSVQITACEPCEPVPTRCIQVENESHMFLCGRTMIPTHNTLLAAGIANYMLCADNEAGAEVYCVATKKDQAMILFRDARVLIDKSGDPDFRAAFDIKRNPAVIEYADAEAFLKPLGRDTEGDTADGLNPHAIIADEIHAWVSLGYWNVLNSALGARSQPLFFQITTAGHNLQSVGRKQRKILERILEGQDGGEGDDYFGVIYTIDEGDDLENPETWAKANPLYGVTVDERKFRSQMALAKADPAIMRELMTKWLNIWINQASSWLDSSKWEKCQLAFDPAKLDGLRCYGGLDLSLTRDLSAFVLAFPPQEGLERWNLLCKFWCPQDDIEVRSRRDKVPYQSWAENGFIIPTPGEVTDHEYIRRDILEAHERYDLRAVGFDRAYSQHIVGPLIDEGVNMMSMSQGVMTISPYAKELEKMVIEGKSLNHFGHPVLTWCAGNCCIETDANGNIKPSKKKSEERIDGIIALIMSLAVGIESEYDGNGWDDPDCGVTKI